MALTYALNEVQKTIEPVRQSGQELIRQQAQRPVQAVAPQVAYRSVQLNRNGLRPADLLAFQRAVGNRSVQRMVANASKNRQVGTAEENAAVQTKPAVGAPSDLYEQGADRVAGQAMTMPEAATQRPNRTGLPDGLKTGIESLSGMSLDGVNVHYNSSQPAQLNALAYTQGNDIHVAPGQERHLPHEAWHVVQQAQGRVLPTMQMKDGVPVNDDQELEGEADVMGREAAAAAARAYRQDTRPDPMPTATARLQSEEEERKRLQSRFETAQRQGAEKDESQMTAAPWAPPQIEAHPTPPPYRRPPPDRLKTGIESFSGKLPIRVSTPEKAPLQLVPIPDHYLPDGGGSEKVIRLDPWTGMDPDNPAEYEEFAHLIETSSATEVSQLHLFIGRRGELNESSQKILELSAAAAASKIEREEKERNRSSAQSSPRASEKSLSGHEDFNRYEQHFAHGNEKNKTPKSGKGPGQSGVSVDELQVPEGSQGHNRVRERLEAVFASSIVAQEGVYEKGVQATKEICRMFDVPRWGSLLVHAGIYLLEKDTRIRLYEEKQIIRDDGEKPSGEWRGRATNVVYVSGGTDLSPVQIAQTLLHELTHLVVDTAVDDNLKYSSEEYAAIIAEWNGAPRKPEWKILEQKPGLAAEVGATVGNFLQYVKKQPADVVKLEVLSHYSEICYALMNTLIPDGDAATFVHGCFPATEAKLLWLTKAVSERMASVGRSTIGLQSTGGGVQVGDPLLELQRTVAQDDLEKLTEYAKAEDLQNFVSRVAALYEYANSGDYKTKNVTAAVSQLMEAVKGQPEALEKLIRTLYPLASQALETSAQTGKFLGARV